MTTRGVRFRLAFDRDVDDQTLLDCIDVAEQAPTASNTGSRRWTVIRDPLTTPPFFRQSVGHVCAAATPATVTEKWVMLNRWPNDNLR